MSVMLSVWFAPIASFFGNAFVITVFIALIILIIEIIHYRRRNLNLDLDEEAIRQQKASAMRIALITGASSGLGREFARLIDKDEILIDELWLIARRTDRLNELAEELTRPCRVLSLDLTDESSFSVIKKELDLHCAQVGLFVNCAGYAKIGNYSAVSFEDSSRMIDLNCRAGVQLTVTLLPYMKPHDRIIQVCSSAAFQPLQHFNIYGASKAFLYQYSRALRMELLPRRIPVTAVCPFWIRDTEFIGIAVDGSPRPPIRHFPFSVTAKRVARSGLLASRKGFAVSTPGWFCIVQRIFTKILPRGVLIWLWEIIRRI